MLAEKIECKICGKMLKRVGGPHLKQHGVSLQEYKARFPDTPTVSSVTRELYTEAGGRGGRACWSNPTNRENHSKRLAELNKRMWKDPFHRERMTEASRRGGRNSGGGPGFNWDDPEFRNKMKKVQSRNMTRLNAKQWKDPKHREAICRVLKSNMLSGMQADRPNKLEMRFYEIALQAGIDVTYTDHRFWKQLKGGRSITPDFMVGDLVIEIYGDYWHKNDDPQDRIDDWASAGLIAIVIWEHELKEPEKVLERLARFLEEAA